MAAVSQDITSLRENGFFLDGEMLYVVTMLSFNGYIDQAGVHLRLIRMNQLKDPSRLAHARTRETLLVFLCFVCSLSLFVCHCIALTLVVNLSITAVVEKRKSQQAHGPSNRNSHCQMARGCSIRI